MNLHSSFNYIILLLNESLLSFKLSKLSSQVFYLACELIIYVGKV